MSTEISCDECEKSFESEDDLLAHLKTEHGMGTEEAREQHPALGPSVSNVDDQPEVTFGEIDASDTESGETADEPAVATLREEQTDGSEDQPTEDAASRPDGPVVEEEPVGSGVSVGEEPVDGPSEAPADSPPSETNATRDAPPEESASESVSGVDGDGHLDRLETDQDYRWFLFGVGGCGGNLIDSVILRSETLRDGPTELNDAWPEAVRGVATVNTNTADELVGTYYAQEYRSTDARTVAERYSIGPDGVQGAGAVEQIGAEAGEYTFAESDSAFAGDVWGAAAAHPRIDSAQAVIFLHSAVKGTGTGATPVIARELDGTVGTDPGGPGELNFDMLNTGLTKFSMPVLPDSTDDELERANGILGFARLAQQVDAVVPFDNENLSEAPDSLRVTIEGTDDYQLHKYRERNEMLVSFLETFAFSGVQKGGNEDSVMGGDGFDLEDAYNPARTLNTGGGDDMAVVMAPAYGAIRTGSGQFTRQALENLVTNTLTEGKLVEFSHETGWGGAFLFETPQSELNRVEGVVNRHFEEIVRRPEHLDTGEDAVEGAQMFPTREQYVSRSDIDSVRLWALVYNPEMPRLSRWRNWAERHRSGPQQYQQRLNEKWDEIESVFSVLGRENLER